MKDFLKIIVVELSIFKNRHMCNLNIDNKKLPSYSTFDRFIAKSQNEIEQLFYQITIKLKGFDEIKGETIYQNRTKIESPSFCI